MTDTSPTWATDTSPNPEPPKKAPNPARSILIIVVAFTVTIVAIVSGASGVVHTVGGDRDFYKKQATSTANKLDLTQNELRSTQRQLTLAQHKLEVNQAETECRSRLSNLVQDRQADLVKGLGDGLRGQLTDNASLGGRAVLVIIDTTKRYAQAIELRGDSVSRCRRRDFRSLVIALTADQPGG